MSNQTERLLLRIQQLEFVVAEFAELLDNSEGVAGLHLNGDIATWKELRNNGWLTYLDNALDADVIAVPNDIKNTDQFITWLRS